MKPLRHLLESVKADVSGPTDVMIDDIVFDSREVHPGTLFAALRGVHHDGHRFIPAAVAAGARAILCEERLTLPGTTVVRVEDASRALAPIAARFWDHPSRQLLMVGITGTNGKTTVSYLVESIFTAAGWPTGVMGTINYRYQGQTVPAPNTTPLASELQRFLARIVQGKGRACVMEVSSHALALGRVDGVDFDVAVFTNLTQDHLDFHKTLESYGQTKLLLFKGVSPETTKPFPRAAVLNRDDPFTETIQASLRVPVITYRLHGPADVFAKHVECDAEGSRFQLFIHGKSVPIRLSLLGEFNIVNALAAAAVAWNQAIPLDRIVKGLEALKGVPGRMERVDIAAPFTVVVDYAHTEDALKHVLAALRRLRPRKLITVFGCGGDRDRIKRPLMGEAAAALSDEVIVTSDNPRSEDPGRITLDVEVGIRRVRSDHYQIILDRREAIAKAFTLAQKGDIVLIAGKGHENYQILPDRTVPFDDRQVARQLIGSTLPS